MNAELRAVADQLGRDLELTSSPVQITYLDAAPAGVTKHPGGAPSVCTFFSEGRRSAFFAELPEHEACEVGAFVLGVNPEGAMGERLKATIGMMHQEGYLAPGEEAKIPRNDKPPRFVAYGPLGSLPMAPTNVLLFANPRSAMLAMEAAPPPVPVNGRPMCAVVPTLNHGAPVAVSIGCVGSRVFTGMGDDQMLVGIRGDYLKEFSQRVVKIRSANRAVGDEDRRRKSGYRPVGSA